MSNRLYGRPREWSPKETKQHELREGPIIEAASFGIAADGSSDDTARLQAAIDRAAASGGIVRLSRGVHAVRELRLKPGLRGITGPGSLRGLDARPEAVLTSTGPFFRSDAPRGFDVMDLEIDCAGTARRAIFFTGVRDVRIRGVRIRNVPPTRSGGKEGIRLMWSCRDVEVSGCDIDLPVSNDPLIGIYVLGKRSGDFFDEPVRHDTTDGYWFPIRPEDGASVRGRELRLKAPKLRRGDEGARVFIDQPRAFTYIDSVRDARTAVLRHALPAASGVTGVVQPGRFLYTEEGACRNISILNNDVYGGKYGVGFDRVDGARIEDNRLEMQVRNISVQTGSRYVKVRRNTCIDAFSTGIHLANGVHHSEVTGNTVRSHRGREAANDNAAINHYVDGLENTISLNKIDANFKFGIYLGNGIRRSRVLMNEIAGSAIGVAVESDWIRGMDGHSHSRNSSVSWVTAVHDTEHLVIRGNTIAAETAAIYLSQITSAWGKVYANRAHVIEENDFMRPRRAHNLYIVETAPGGVRELDAVPTGRVVLPRGTAHFNHSTS